MKAFTIAIILSFVVPHAFGQGAQADQIKRRAKELSNQNNVRQGVPPPSQPPRPPPATQPQPTSAAAKPVVSNPQQNIAKIQADLAALKPGTPATAEQKQQLVKDMAVAVRGGKPSLPTVTAFANSLTTALADKSLDPEKQTRLAKNIEAVLNSASATAIQFDAIIADVQAILQVGGVKRTVAIDVSNDLKAIGSEVRRGNAK